MSGAPTELPNGTSQGGGDPGTRPPRGRIELICGCMFAGKTARLIERLRAAQAVRRRTLAIKHVIDVRYGARELATHDGRRHAARACRDAAEVAAVVAAHRAEVVGIDEVQFFGRELAEVCRTLAAGGVDVIAVGLEHDAWGRPFPPVPQLAGMADSVTVMTVPCGVCGAEAHFTQRMTPVVDGNMIGGPGDYEPRCAACFRPL
jgi:thymidine kinase